MRLRGWRDPLFVQPVTTLTVAFVSDAVVPALRSPHLDWHVHSVFRQAVNLVAAGQLVAIAPQAAGGLPNGISVEGHPDFRALGVAEGMAVVGRWPWFEFPERGVMLDLRRAWTWSPRLPAGTIDPHDPGVRRRTNVAADLVAARASRVGFGQCAALLRPPNGGRGVGPAPTPEDLPVGSGLAIPFRAIVALRNALAAGDLPAALEAEEHLVGLGEGLTPSGDDLLVGLSAALRSARHAMADELAVHAAARARGATGDVARAALELAAQGYYAERLHDVLGAVAYGDDASVRAQARRALAWGASSGADTMLGVLIGLEGAEAA